jgi:hypothetical protein
VYNNSALVAKTRAVLTYGGEEDPAHQSLWLVQLLYLTYFGKTLRAVTLKYFVQPKAATNQKCFLLLPAKS